MYGRIYETTYTGSMRGAGAVVFAVWGYVIATMREDKGVGVQVELRPTNLAFYIGETEEAICAAIEYLCRPDSDSLCEDEEGRRLVPVGKFVYRVVSGPKYMAIRNAEELRAYNREAQARFRKRERPGPEAGQADLDVAAMRRRQERVRAKIAREEEIEAGVRAKFNPGATGERKEPLPGEEGLSIGEIVRRRVELDPFTVADREEMSAKERRKAEKEEEQRLEEEERERKEAEEAAAEAEKKRLAAEVAEQAQEAWAGSSRKPSKIRDAFGAATTPTTPDDPGDSSNGE
jgi:hypothetical protein